MASSTRAYGSDLAYIHDVGFSFHAEGAAPGLLELFERSGLTGGLVVDLGCGGGGWAKRLADAGYGVLGVDISRPMVAMARKRVPGGRFIAASFLDYELPRCRAVTALGEVFNYLFDGRNGRAAMRAFFRRVLTALEPGGLFVFDVAEPGRTQRAHGGWEGEDWAIIVGFTADPKKRRLTREITTFRKIGRQYRRASETHTLRLWSGQELAHDLRRVGFRARVVRGYGDYRFPEGQAGLIARKPG